MTSRQCLFYWVFLTSGDFKSMWSLLCLNAYICVCLFRWNFGSPGSIFKLDFTGMNIHVIESCREYCILYMAHYDWESMVELNYTIKQNSLVSSLNFREKLCLSSTSLVCGLYRTSPYCIHEAPSEKLILLPNMLNYPIKVTVKNDTTLYFSAYSNY